MLARHQQAIRSVSIDVIRSRGWWTLKCLAHSKLIIESTPLLSLMSDLGRRRCVWVSSDWCEVSVTCNIITTNNGGVSTSSSTSFFVPFCFLSELILISGENATVLLMQRDIALVADWISFRQICETLNERENCSLRCKIANTSFE